ncbi:MAG TPA: response regulator [Sedimentisphaerales bacterium]|nr:response regulator [Sedimentisphaerales bacterium]
MEKRKPILLIEDDDLDAMTVERSLRDLGIANQLIRLDNGEQAIDYLRRGDSRPPCLILLDLNMPKMNGIEFLKVVKADKILRMIPVVVLTTSHEQRDIVESFELSVAGYMVKSADYAEAARIIRMIDKYWTLSETPGQVAMG